jgi:hypothetical protein
MVQISDELKELERMRDRARRNEASELAYAERKGASGKAVEIAQKMKARGDSMSSIEEVTGLTLDEVLRL